MLSVNTTMVAVVGVNVAPGIAAVSGANCRVVLTDPDLPALRRARVAHEAAAAASVPYLIHDADPLAAVAEAWVAHYDGHGTPGDLEVAVAETLARWRAKNLELPDYYLVVDAEELPATRRHWYLGVMGAAAPARVMAGRSDRLLIDQLDQLRAGRWWPPLDRLLDGVDTVVPDHVAPLGTDRGDAGPDFVTGVRPASPQ